MGNNADRIKSYRYSIVTPVRNEEAVLQRTVQSVIDQTIRPGKWVILDDGSTDKTGEILNFFSNRYTWIEIIHTEKQGSNYWDVQEKLAIAFNRIDFDQNEYIGKLDADIELSCTYFEDLLRKNYLDPKLGIAGGTLYYYTKNRKIVEKCPPDHVRGGLKLYKVQCWKDIGGMEFKMGYDTIDEVKANMLGWKTRSFKDIEALHHRPTGKRMGTFKWHFYLGKDHYVAGYHPIFLIVKCIKDMAFKPYIINGVAKLVGYFACYLKGAEKSIEDKDYIKFLRKKQIRRLIFWIK